MNLADFLTQVVTGLNFSDLIITTEMQLAVFVAGVNIVVMVIEKVFGLFGLVLSQVKGR